MRKLLFLFLFAEILSCKTTPKVEPSTVSDSFVDSVIKAKQAAMAPPDSIQKKVIGDIKFGMSVNETNNLITKFKKQTLKFHDQYVSDYFIGNFQYYNINPEFYKGKLYKIIITGGTVHWDNYDIEIPKQLQAINSVLTQSLGSPTIVNTTLTKSDLKKGYTYRVYEWIIGKKSVAVRLEDLGLDYQISVHILQAEIEQIIEDELQRKKDSLTSADKKVF